MLQVSHITKTYRTGDFIQTALNDVSLNFRENEFVAVLGQSGSGKTTFLNVIGGLDRYDSGDLIINEKSTREFKSADWDTYRNNSVGFIFQSYQLIGHLSILDNVEMGMTLSGVSAGDRRKKALDVLERVGLKDHLHKKPAQLSGGQMQRVAIARALANDPDIILADEPTGALDTETSHQIMRLIRQIAKDKLVIMVTHNPELAEQYADRIVRFSDGRVVDDSHPCAPNESTARYVPKKTSMSFPTALKLSFKNILTKKGRTVLTSFASSIGIIGIALVLSLSNGFDQQINKYETGTLSNFPIIVNQNAMSLDLSSPPTDGTENLDKFPETDKIYPYSIADNTVMHTNKITAEYIEYLEKFDQSLLDGVAYSRNISMNLLRMTDGKAVAVNTQAAGFSTFPSKENSGDAGYLSEYYDLLAGSFITDSHQVMLLVDEYNRLDVSQLEALGLDSNAQSIDFSSVLGKEFKLIYNDDYYIQRDRLFTVNGNPADLSELYHSQNAVTLTVCGIIRINSDANISALSTGLLYSDALAREFIANAENSEIVKAQRAADYNVLTGQVFEQNGQTPANPMAQMSGTAATKEAALEALGAETVPSGIYLFPVDFDAKEELIAYLEAWNGSLAEEDQIIHTDMAEIITILSGSIMSAITMVLVAFAAISLVVSMIMIGIIIYISVLERTKEIGVLRALGARKKDITRVFNAETFLIGSFSGLLGIGLAYLLTIPTNLILKQLTDLSGVAQLNPLHALILVLISIVLTLIGGFIPAKIAAKKDPVEALRSE